MNCQNCGSDSVKFLCDDGRFATFRCADCNFYFDRKIDMWDHDGKHHYANEPCEIIKERAIEILDDLIIRTRKMTVEEFKEREKELGYDQSNYDYPEFHEKENIESLLEEANSILHSAHYIAERQGQNVSSWEGFKARVDKALDNQHRFMYPEYHVEKSLALYISNLQSEYDNSTFAQNSYGGWDKLSNYTKWLERKLYNNDVPIIKE